MRSVWFDWDEPEQVPHRCYLMMSHRLSFSMSGGHLAYEPSGKLKCCAMRLLGHQSLQEGDLHTTNLKLQIAVNEWAQHRLAIETAH